MKIKKVISGGQTGVDQAALQAAIDSGIEHDGWCPPGRVCEDGIIPDQFKLKETPKERDDSAPEIPRSQRTIWNVRDSDGLLVFKVTGSQRCRGTELALDAAKKLGKALLILDLSDGIKISDIINWISKNDIQILSVGGLSEGTYPGIYHKAYKVLSNVFSELK